MPEVVMVLAWLVGCSLGLEPQVVDSEAPVVEVPPDISWTIEPTTLALGETCPGVPTVGRLTVTNTGDDDLFVLDFDAELEDNLGITLAGVPMLAPGASTALDVEWTPVEPGIMSSALSVSIGASAAEAQAVEVPVTGTALGATVTLSSASYDFGEVGIDCEGEFTLTVTNTGNTAMEVGAVRVQGDGYTLEEPDDLPWTLNPFQSHEQTVRFSPSDLGSMYGEVTFETDVGDYTTVLQGSGVVDEERTLTYDVGEQGRSTFIVDVNLTAIPGSTEDQYSTYFVAALPTFFQTLLDNHARFRAGFVWSVNGTVDGAYDYIDETFTASQATTAALAMIAPGATGGDNDANFRTLQNAIVANTSWLFEDSAWSESRLCLFTIQRDTEASGGSWANWVAQAQATKDDPANIVYHAIAGPVPGGCGSAEAFADYHLAVDATGGMLLSVCAPDWTDHMARIATACTVGTSGIFALEGNPMASSIQVSVDDIRQLEGWTYDASLNAIVFDDDAYPDLDATVTIYYWMSGSCG